MKKLSLFVTTIVIMTLQSMASPVNAARNEPIGERIRVFNGEREFPAETSFNIWHGWIQPSTDDAIGIFDFELEIDGVPQQESFKWFYTESGDPDSLYRIWVYNFPEGMTGEHTFTGHWFAPCQYAVDQLRYPGPCPTANAKVETTTRTLIITFVP